MLNRGIRTDLTAPKGKFHELSSGHEAWGLLPRLRRGMPATPGGPPAVGRQVDRDREHAPDSTRQARARGSRHETGPTVCSTSLVGAP